MGHLRAATQYDDWKGELAADAATEKDIHSLFEANEPAGHILVGWSLYASEADTPILEGIFAPGGSFEDAVGAVQTLDPLPVATVRIELTADDFFRLFKRFHLVGIKNGIDLSGRNLDGYDE
jgi:hypothetical protein